MEQALGWRVCHNLYQDALLFCYGEHLTEISLGKKLEHYFNNWENSISSNSEAKMENPVREKEERIW